MNIIKTLTYMVALYLMAPAILILAQAFCYVMGVLFFIVFAFALIGVLNVNKVSDEDIQGTHQGKD